VLFDRELNAIYLGIVDAGWSWDECVTLSGVYGKFCGTLWRPVWAATSVFVR